jgi:hypothetical protein
MPRRPFWALTNRYPGGTFAISRQSFVEVDKFIRDAEGDSIRTMEYTDLLVRMMAGAVKGFAQRMATGPIAPGGISSPALAFKIPVQRITGRYLAGWKMRRYGSGRWMVYNDDRAAFFIEEGIFRSPRRVRRPILRLAVISMLRMIQTTRVADQLVGSLLRPRRDAQGRFQSFKARMEGSSLQRGFGSSGTPL